MKRYLMLALAVIAVFAVTVPSYAADAVGARLRGFEEVPPISSGGGGFLFASVNDAGTELQFSLVYFNLESTVTQAHIHVGQSAVNGGIVLFFCTNLTPPAGVPAPPACPNNVGPNVVSGTLTAANVVSQTAQGIGVGDFSEVVRAILAGVTYANVHSTVFPGGEIRGQISR